MRIMGLDFGSKTTGVAVSDPLGITAQGLETITRTYPPVVMWDERVSTYAEDHILFVSGVRRENRKSVIDKIAAVLILQGYLDLQAQGKAEE